MMETTERILDDSLRDVRKHTESISSSISRGKGFHSSFHNSLPVETLYEGHPWQQARTLRAQHFVGMDMHTEQR